MILLSLISIVEALQIVVAMAWVLQKVTLSSPAFVKDLYPYFQLDVHPEFEMLIYRSGVISACVVMAMLYMFFHKRLEQEDLKEKLVAWLLITFGLLTVQVFVAFKLIIWSVSWGAFVFIVTLIVALLVRVFWMETYHVIKKIKESHFLSREKIIPAYYGDIFAILSIFLIVTIVDMRKVLALIFTQDQFYHLDGFLMAPVLGISHQLVLNQDMISQYGTFLPKIFASVMMALKGDISYSNLVWVLMALSILYWIAFYVLMRVWFKNTLLCVTGLLLAIKWQMFHWGVWPIIWRFGTPTVVRHIFDLPVLACLFMSQKTGKRRWGYAACLLSGFAISYMTDTGMYLAFAVSFFILLSGLFDIKKLATAVAQIMTIPCGALFGFYLASGSFIFTGLFWKNSFEHASLFLAGFGSLPITDALQQGQFYCFFKGLVIPFFYVAVLLWHMMKFFDNRQDRFALWIASISLYGLGMYHYFINRSAFTSFDVVCVPLVLCLMVMASKISVFSLNVRRCLTGALLCIVVISLFTNPIFALYPNIFNYKNPQLKNLDEYYRQWGDFTSDGALIAQFSTSSERVAVISSFEVALLMSAKRKPYFYYTPLIESTQWSDTTFRGLYLHQHKRVKKTLEAFHAFPPQTVVVETRLINSSVAALFMLEQPVLKLLIDTVKKDYKVVAQGEHVVIFKR